MAGSSPQACLACLPLLIRTPPTSLHTLLLYTSSSSPCSTAMPLSLSFCSVPLVTLPPRRLLPPCLHHARQAAAMCSFRQTSPRRDRSSRRDEKRPGKVLGRWEGREPVVLEADGARREGGAGGHGED
eukprot:747268-Hanusia_phi.AAC.2